MTTVCLPQGHGRVVSAKLEKERICTNADSYTLTEGNETLIGSIDYYIHDCISGLKQVRTLFITALNNHTLHERIKVQGVGTLLIECVIAESLDPSSRCAGRVHLRSVQTATSFYHKMGFEIDWKLKEELNGESLARNRRAITLDPMHLSEEGLIRWKRTILGSSKISYKQPFLNCLLVQELKGASEKVARVVAGYLWRVG